jgi:hypothetical protein
VIVEDYARSARAGAVQVSWLWAFGSPAGQVDDVDLFDGVWSARPATMVDTLRWLEAEHGGVAGYLAGAGLDAAVVSRLRSRLLAD